MERPSSRLSSKTSFGVARVRARAGRRADADRSARDEERRRLKDLILHVDESIFFERNAPVGLPFGIGFHRVAAPLPIRHALVFPEMYDATQRADMRDEESVRLSQILALQRQRQALVGFEKFS